MKRDELALRLTYAFLFAAFGFYIGPSIGDTIGDIMAGYLGLDKKPRKSSEKVDAVNLPDDNSSYAVEENTAARGEPDNWQPFHKGNLSRKDAEELCALMFDPLNRGLTWRIREVPAGYSSENAA